MCTACGAGTFKAGPGDAECDNCPSNSTSPVQSNVSTSCECNAGWTGTNVDGPCTACVVGTYKSADGSHGCSVCLQSKYSPETGSRMCLSCPAGKYVSDNASTCKMFNTTWEHGMYTHCKLNMTFQDLRDEDKERSKTNLHVKYRTGGLGVLMQQTLFEVWLCVEEHNCSHPNGDWFCWVVDESVAFPDERAPDQYVAWGYNSDLNLF